MLDLPGHPILDKHALIGACLRLPLKIDGNRLRTEVTSLPSAMWGTTGGRIGVHTAAEALFLRGYAPAEGPKPIEDREPLQLLPYAREIIENLIPAPPLRCLLAKLPALAVIQPHIDRAPYFSKSIRIHLPIETHEQSFMLCSGQGYLMRLGEVWALNNSAEHAVWNAHSTLHRTHMICDFLATPELLGLLATGDRNLGKPMPDVERHVRSPAARAHAMAGG
jgi:hypothetical protein